MLLAAGFPWDVLLTTGATVLGISGILGAAIAWGRINLAKTTLDLYKADNEALRSRIDTLESEKVALQHECASTAGRLATIETANRVLADQVTGASAVEHLGTVLTEQHRQVIDMLRLLGVEIAKRVTDPPKATT